MANEDLRKVSHIGLWIVVFIIGAWLVWSATHTTTENNRYGANTIVPSETNNNYGLVNLRPCGAFFAFDGQKKEPKK